MSLLVQVLRRVTVTDITAELGDRFFKFLERLRRNLAVSKLWLLVVQDRLILLVILFGEQRCLRKAGVYLAWAQKFVLLRSFHLLKRLFRVV